MNRLDRIRKGETENYIAPFLWLHNEDDKLIVNELKRIRDCGIGAVCIESRTHEEFCKEDWWGDVRLILDTCKSLGMKLWILDDKHFPSGYANGIYEKEENRALRALCVRARRVDIAGPLKEGCILADEWRELPDDSFIGAVALRRSEDRKSFDGEYIDISDSYSHGRYYFDLPEGVWSIVIFISTRADLAPRNRAYGNKLSKEATEAYIKEVYEGHYAHFADDFGETLLGFFADEPQFHNYYGQGRHAIGMGEAFSGYPWHDSLRGELEYIYGDELMAMLARLWYNFSDGSHMGVRESFMDMITRRYSECFCQPIGRWCSEHGVRYIGHVIEDNGSHRSTGYGVGHYFRALEGQHMSGVDVVLHQIMPGLCGVSNTGYVSYKEMDDIQNHYILAKLASSAAHIDPKKSGRAMCEIFGAFGWAEDLEFMKYLIDHFLVRGINYFVPHAFSPKENDTDCPPNFYNSGKNPQFKYFGMLMSYINRICTFTDGAVHKPTCAVIYDAEASWSTGEFIDNRDICKLLYDSQLDYDIIPLEALDSMDGDGFINGEFYPVVLLPYSEYYSDRDLVRIKEHRERILCVGESGVCDLPSVSIDKLVGIMEEYRDVYVLGEKKYLRYSHYSRDGEDHYLISNEDTDSMKVSLRLRGFNGGSYVLWDAFENRVVSRWSQGGTIDLEIAPGNLLVLVPNTQIEGASESYTYDSPKLTRSLEPLWRVEICAEKDMPAFKKYKDIKALTSITSPKELPDFTGNMRYTAIVELDPEKERILDLGTVGQTAEVYLNGKHIGTRLFHPYRFDMSDAIKKGENILEIIVTNTCVYEQRDGFSRFMAIKPSGLLGPVMV